MALEIEETVTNKRSLSEKKLKRLANKKRKIEAFLDLVAPKEDKCEIQDEVASLDQVQEVSNVKMEVKGTDADELLKLRRKLRKQELLAKPRFALTDKGKAARHIVAKESEVKPELGEPIDLFELQVMLLSCFMAAPRRSFHPTWCDMQRCEKAARVCVFILDGDFAFTLSNEELAQFQEVVRFEQHPRWVDKLMNVPLSNYQVAKTCVAKGVKPQQKDVEDDEDDAAVETSPDGEGKNPKPNKATKTQLVMSAVQMAVESFPLPGDETFVPTKDSYSAVSEDSPLFALDCEMCLTEGNVSEVTRVSVVDEEENVLYDTFIKPDNKIIDYLTRYSGITPEIMEKTTTKLAKAQRKIRKLLPDNAIICGQSLNVDLKVLGLMHPYVIDTSVVYNLSGVRAIKTSLKTLSARFLNEQIQDRSHDGHCSIEDSLAALKLVKLKLKEGIEYGDNVLSKKKFSWARAKENSLSLAKYMEVKEIKMSVFYDYVDLECDKFVSIYSGSGQLRQNISKCLSAENTICVVLTGEGLCYVHF